MLLEGVFGRGGDLIPARGDTDLGNDTRVVTRVAYPFTEMCSEFSGSVCLQKSPPNTARFRERKIPGLLPQTQGREVSLTCPGRSRPRGQDVRRRSSPRGWPWSQARPPGHGDL